MYSEEIDMCLLNYDEQLDKNLAHLKDELLQIRAGRANPKIIERVVVDYYGTPTPLSQMSTISVPDPRMVCVSLWDISMMKTVQKAIEVANLGLTPSDDGRVIRLVFPVLTEERRRELAKEISKLCEGAKVVARNARRDILDEFKKMKKDSIVTEDDYARMEKDVQKRLDDCIASIDAVCDKKSKEIMEV